MSRTVIMSMLAFLLSASFVSPVAADDAISDIDSLVAQALADNPEVQASQARWDAFVQRIRQAGTFEDPMLMLKLQNLPVRYPLEFDREPMTGKVIGISQMIPFYGKRDLKRQTAELEADVARWEFEERRIELQRMVKESWYQLSYVDRWLEIVDRNIAILDDLTRYAEAVYGVGRGLQQDVLKAQVERSRMEDMRITLQQKRRSLEISINALLFRPVDTPIPVTDEQQLTPYAGDPQGLAQLAEENRPLLKSLKVQIDKAKIGRRLAEKEFYPDFTLSLEYMQREQLETGGEGLDMYSAGITFNLPLQRERRHAMVAETEADTRMAENELNMLRNQIRLGIADGLARIDRSQNLTRLYLDGILPQAASSYEAALAAYRAGKGDFMNVLDSRMALFNYEREYHDAVAEHEMQLAQLEATVGTKLP